MSSGIVRANGPKDIAWTRKNKNTRSMMPLVMHRSGMRMLAPAAQQPEYIERDSANDQRQHHE